MSKYIVIASLALLAGCSAGVPDSSLPPNASVSPQLDAIATSALHAAFRVSADMEVGGAIISTPTGYRVSGMTLGTEQSLVIRIYLHRGEHLAAIFHTHPGEAYERPDLFSPTDVATAKRLRVPSYIGVVYDHQIRRFLPGEQTDVFMAPFERVASGQAVSTSEAF